MKHTLIGSLILFLMTFWPQVTWGQFRTSVSLFSSYDDNPFRNSFQRPDYITTGVLSLEYIPNELSLRFFATGNLSMFKEFSDRRYFSNTVGISYTKPFGEDEENALYAGTSYFMRFNRASYDYYDFSQFIGYVNLKYYLDYSKGLMSRAGYRLRYRDYKNLEEFSYLEHYGFVQISKFFESKTTVLAELDLGNKNYVLTLGSMFTAPGSMNEGGMMGGWMNGRMNQNTRYISYSRPSTTQLIGILRVAQSLTQTTGLSLQYLRRWDVSERTRFLSGGAVDFQGDEELWDDPYGYQGNEYNITLTQHLPWEITARLSTDYLAKDYARRTFTATDTDTPTGPLRSDTRFVVGVDVRKSFGEALGFFDGFTISLSYFYQRNKSNDPYYDFRNNSLNIGLATQF